MSFCFKPSRPPREDANVLLLCHANNHNFKQLNTQLFKDKQSGTNYETMCISDKPDMKVDITITKAKADPPLPLQKYKIIISVYCPSEVFFDDNGDLIESTFQNIKTMLQPGGVFVFSLPISVDNLNIDGYINECTHESTTDINKVIKKLSTLQSLKAHAVYKNTQDDGQGFFTNDNNTQGDYYGQMQNIISLFDDVKLDFIKWSEWNDKRLIVLQKVSDSQMGGGKKLHSTKEKIMTKKGPRVVYEGPRGGKYVKLDGKYVRIKHSYK
jgi:hypothetical protein